MSSEESVVVGEGLEEVVAPVEPVELIRTSGIGGTVFRESTSVFTPAPQEDQTPEQRAEFVREKVKVLRDVEDRLHLAMGEFLYEIFKNGYWREWEFIDELGETRKYSSFGEYTQNECNLKQAKAKYLIDIYETFVIALELPKEVLAGLEWTKAKELRKVITPSNAFELLDKVKGLNYNQVLELVKSIDAESKGLPSPDGESSGGGGGSEPSTKMSTLTFKVTVDQAEVINNALSAAKGMCGSDKTGAQLEFICMDFLAGTVGTGMHEAFNRLEKVIEAANRTFGVVLEVKSVDPDRYGGLDAGEDAAPAAGSDESVVVE